MKAVFVFLIGVVIGWVCAPRAVPDVVELEPIVPGLEPGLSQPWITPYDGSDRTHTWTRSN